MYNPFNELNQTVLRGFLNLNQWNNFCYFIDQALNYESILTFTGGFFVSKLYVGNVSWTSTEDELKAHFEKCGPVNSAKIIMDRQTGRSRGFAFVEMENGEAAIAELDGKDFGGRPLKISVAKERSQEEPRGTGGFRGPKRNSQRDFQYR